MTKLLIALAGLPGTGKSSLAARLREELAAVVLNKDEVRTLLFPPPALDFSRTQDDICMAAIYHAAAAILQSRPGQAVILDGRTFLRAYQVHELFSLAASLQESPRLIECACATEVAQARLEQARVQGAHPAANRTFALYLSLKAQAEPIQIPHLLLDTGELSLEECVQRSLSYLNG